MKLRKVSSTSRRLMLGAPIAALALTALGFTGCPASEREEGKPTSLLRLHGSNTIGSELGPALAEAFLREQGARDIRRARRAEEVEMTIEGILPDESTVSVIEIEAHGSSTSFTALKESRADIGMSSRPIAKKEVSSLESLGNLQSRASEHVLALDGLAVVVHESNPLDKLEIEDIQRIFTGQITNWSKVGGPRQPIHLYARDEKSGTFDTFKSLVLSGKEISSRAKRFEDSHQLSEAVAQDVDGIGFIGMPFIGETRALKVFEGSSVPMQPNRLTVGTEDYRLSRRLYLYTASAPESPWVRKFIEFALSDEGQKVVESVGFIGQALGHEEDDEDERSDSLAAEDLSPRYRRHTSGAERQPFNVRFATGSSDLDNKAYRDVGRLLQLVEDSRDQQIEVILLGFTDDLGDPEENLELSRRRAEAVKNELIAIGIIPPEERTQTARTVVVDGFGEEKPVASNGTEEGRSKNRRVEVWLRR